MKGETCGMLGERMKVLLVLDNLSLDSGVSSIVMNLYRNIGSVSFDFLVFKEGKRSYAAQVRENGDRVYLLKNPLSPKTLLGAYTQLKRFFKEHAKDYDAVHLHSPTLNEFTLRFAKQYGVKHLIMHSHSSMTSTNTVKRVLNSILTRNVTRYANHYWTCSDKAAGFLYGEDFVGTHHVELVRNAVEPSRYAFSAAVRDTQRECLGLAGKTVFAHVSNFSPIKNLPFLLPAIAAVTQANPNAKFLFVGDGPERATFEGLLREQGLSDHCLFVGRQTDVVSYLQAADALLLPSLKEGLPVTVVEAQANGLPCFVSDTITRECSVGNVRYLPLLQEAWTEALRGFQAYTADERLGNSRRFVDTSFNIRIEAARIEKLYLEMSEVNG